MLVGQEPTDALVDGMMSEAPGPLNFTMFLTLFGEKLTGELNCFVCVCVCVCVWDDEVVWCMKC